MLVERNGSSTWDSSWTSATPFQRVEVQAVDPKPAGRSHDGRDGPARHDGKDRVRFRSHQAQKDASSVISSTRTVRYGVGLSTIPPSRRTFCWRRDQDKCAISPFHRSRSSRRQETQIEHALTLSLRRCLALRVRGLVARAAGSPVRPWGSSLVLPTWSTPAPWPRHSR
jgi:hypothetical protein